MLHLNRIANNGGKVVAHFGAYSSTGGGFSFTSENFICNRQQDRHTGSDDDGLSVVMAPPLGDTDWAYFRTSSEEGLKYDANMSKSLERGLELTVLGFPLGLGTNPSYKSITPQLSRGITTANGLTNGIILTTDAGYEEGNSGSPVFYKDSSGNLIVIGIVSSGVGRSTGFVVPISVIK